MTTPSRLLLLDTNIVIFLTQAGATGQAIEARYELRARSDRPLLSVVTLGEALAFGRLRNWGPPRMARLRDVLREFVAVDIRSQAVLERYAEIDTYLKGIGRAVADNDVWIAACASAADATLLTSDRDFDPLDPSYLTRIWIDPRDPGATS